MTLGNSRKSEGSVHLDALRGAAALLVFANHTRALYFSSPLNPTESVGVPEQAKTSSMLHHAGADQFGEAKFAGEAVIIFFVLSGYLVGGSVIRSFNSGQWSWKMYLTKRLTRLYVVLIPALVIGVTLDYIGSKVFGLGSVYTGPRGIELVTTWHLAERFRFSIYLGNALFLENFVVPYAGTNVSLWSLANEFWYYLTFPFLVLAFMSRQRFSGRLACILIALAIMTFTGIQIAVLFPVWMMGAFISQLPRGIPLAHVRVLSIGSALLLIATMFGVRLTHLSVIPADYLIGATASLLIYCLVQQTEDAKPNLYRTLAGFFSEISYSLYLFHVPLSMFICGLVNSPWHQWAKTPINLLQFVIIDLVVIALVFGLWRLFEANTEWIRAKIFERESNFARPSIGNK